MKITDESLEKFKRFSANIIELTEKTYPECNISTGQMKDEKRLYYYVQIRYLKYTHKFIFDHFRNECADKLGPYTLEWLIVDSKNDLYPKWGLK